MNSYSNEDSFSFDFICKYGCNYNSLEKYLFKEHNYYCSEVIMT